MVYRTITLATVAVLLAVPVQAGPFEPLDDVQQEVDDRLTYLAAIEAGAAHLLDRQLPDGSFPILGPPSSPNPHISVQGAIPHGLLESFKATGNLSYLGIDPTSPVPLDEITTGVLGARNYLVDRLAGDDSITLTTSGIYFIAEVGVLTANRDDLDLAREHMDRWTGSLTADEFMDFLFDNRGTANQNMAFWDMGRFIRSAHDIGDIGLAHELGDAMAAQTRVDVFDASANWNEYGISGFVFGLSESDYLAHQDAILDAIDTLVTTRTCEDGGFSFTYYTFDECDSVQSTAFGVQSLAYAGNALPRTDALKAACDNLVAEQNDEGFYRYSGTEYMQTNADALVGLSACMAPLRNYVTSYADAAIQFI